MARANGHKLKNRKSHLNVLLHPIPHLPLFFYIFFFKLCGQAVQQVAQRGCGVFTPGDIQNSTGCGPEQPGVGDYELVG